MATVTLHTVIRSLLFGIMMFTIVTSAASRLFSPLPDSPSTTPHEPVHGDHTHYKVHSEMEEDYGPWNPTPNFGGGYESPIPHGQVWSWNIQGIQLYTCSCDNVKTIYSWVVSSFSISTTHGRSILFEKQLISIAERKI